MLVGLQAQLLHNRGLRTTINNINKRVSKPKVISCNNLNMLEKYKQNHCYNKDIYNQEKTI